MVAKTPVLSRLLSGLEVNRDTDAPVDIYVNKDTRPLPPSRRPYGPWHFVGLWMITGSFNVGGWTTGSSLISLGLNVWVCFPPGLSECGCWER
jgi:NCS1 family nucleobase:cation symporter-1